jgi:quinoprotein glucose dehydrogenase
MKFAALVSSILTTLLALPAGPAQGGDWSHYGGDQGGTRFSELTQVNRSNVGQLRVAWQVRTGAAQRRGPLLAASQFQATPIITPAAAGSSVVVCTPWNRIIALDPETGETRWEFDPKLRAIPLYNCRGVSYWEDPLTPPTEACRHRIFSGTGDLRLLALDARTGQPCDSFGIGGEVRIEPLIIEDSPEYKRGEVKFFSPPVIVRGIVVLGSGTFAKNKRVRNPSGALRGFDARSGQLRWTFDPIPRSADDPEHGNWSPTALEEAGAASAWAPLSGDEKLGLVFAPTSSASPDFYGGFRPGENRYANSTVALDALTGKVAWHFQNIHHDVWDWDSPAQPIAADLEIDGERKPIVIQLTKQGLVFVFDRRSGKPIFEIEERPVNQDGLPGDVLSTTQPFPMAPPPLSSASIYPEDAWGITVWEREFCRRAIASHDHGPAFTPVKEKGTVSVSSINNWAGGAFDRSRNLLITNVSNLFWITRAIPEAEYDRSKFPSMGQPAEVVEGLGYAFIRNPLLSPLGIPCTAPPWGKLVAVDLIDGTIRWSVPLGHIGKLAPVPLPLQWGTPGTAGGPIVTAGGLVFIGATTDELFRAFDVETGQELWSARLPTAAHATPMTYAVGGKQFILIAAGGHVWQYPKISDHIIAFALP